MVRVEHELRGEAVAGGEGARTAASGGGEEILQHGEAGVRLAHAQQPSCDADQAIAPGRHAFAQHLPIRGEAWRSGIG